MTTTAPVTSPPPTAPLGTSTTANGTDPTGVLNFTQKFDTFLTLLTTQLKNQDPLAPTDTNQFTQELVSFSGVEQQIKTNSQLATLLNNETSAETISALPSIGRTIEYQSNQGALQNGSATFSYTLPSAAAKATINILDSTGNIVASAQGNPSAGKHSFTWNGQNASGLQLADGTYTLQVLAVDSKNQQITTTTTATGTIDNVSVINNAPTFDVSGISVPFSQLVKFVTSSNSTTSP
ncbi:MAG TPA: flagellar hook capping FlgD N-terminal domain-containing protein [Stellaceae bacterium]|nr:flagellar hook capping FlgD N-terminal domain-containing protein [Stellaceae bacterium]